ncbi:U5 snRNP-associated protein Prp18 [Schizosaccharomyces cryophilus OY26]|uniref:Pre-mRNA-splicing factor 18 n=1 Tax=Schizosaccharomyces cryophilus (strain OY26 / ATCC MYA-4695 / CBS 11777 / NBRC 106824 / NRRL Y48691) TaxID=653667 RepID=S9VYC7_SCHCR|nr:U5 snRNP-associated protein Prp18 [Schizosaccharomyces cryophilus OY26]EPY51264.1 U5 snRNP-associated protein Prp18 [Schizosaccharomyces cryophilus OY26]
MKMDFLKEEIEKKRRQLEGKNDIPAKKAFRRGDWEKERERKYLEEQREMELKKEEKKRKLDEEKESYEKERLQSISKIAKVDEALSPSSPVVTGTAESPRVSESQISTKSTSPSTRGEHSDLPHSEVIRKLREMKEPIKLFGESEEALVKRFFKIQKEKQVEQLEQDLLSRGVELIEYQRASIEKPRISKQVVTFLRRGIYVWDKILISKPITEQNNPEGQGQLKIFRQAKQDLETLIRLLIDGALNDDIFSKIAEICYRCQRKEFVKANDVYLQLTIGNAPWPIGVTMVGIHERSAHQRLKRDPNTNILKDEKKRKCLQALKRFITFSEREDPDWFSEKDSS